MQLRHLRVLSYIPPDAARFVTVDGVHETMFRVTTLTDPMDLGACIAAMAASSAVQE
jgi:hypothetical protein